MQSITIYRMHMCNSSGHDSPSFVVVVRLELMRRRVMLKESHKQHKIMAAISLLHFSRFPLKSCIERWNGTYTDQLTELGTNQLEDCVHCTGTHRRCCALLLQILEEIFVLSIRFASEWNVGWVKKIAAMMKVWMVLFHLTQHAGDGDFD